MMLELASIQTADGLVVLGSKLFPVTDIIWDIHPGRFFCGIFLFYFTYSLRGFGDIKAIYSNEKIFFQRLETVLKVEHLWSPGEMFRLRISYLNFGWVFSFSDWKSNIFAVGPLLLTINNCYVIPAMPTKNLLNVQF